MTLSGHCPWPLCNHRRVFFAHNMRPSHSDFLVNILSKDKLCACIVKDKWLICHNAAQPIVCWYFWEHRNFTMMSQWVFFIALIPLIIYLYICLLLLEKDFQNSMVTKNMIYLAKWGQRTGTGASRNPIFII